MGNVVHVSEMGNANQFLFGKSKEIKPLKGIGGWEGSIETYC